MKNKKTVLLLVVLFAALLVGASALYNSLSSQVETQTLAGENVPTEGTSTSQEAAADENGEDEDYTAPDFTVVDGDGSQVHLSDYLGTPVVLNFWASWCSPCKSEMPEFDEAAAKYEGQVQFMMVNLTDGSQETVESAQSFIDSQGYTFPVFYDTEYSAAYAYGTSSIPMTFFVDSDGNLVTYARGAIDGETLELGISMILPEE